MKSNLVYVHADESCLGNQFQEQANPGGAAGLVEICRSGCWERSDYWISEPDTTNNRMALRSAIEVLRALPEASEVRFVSDSQYLVRGVAEWLASWKARGWRRRSGPVENLELWQELDAELQHHHVEMFWVRGHAGHPRNEYANHLATQAAKNLSQSGGLIPSRFREWLEAQRARGRYRDAVEPLEPEC